MDNLTARTADFGAQVSPMTHRHRHHDQVKKTIHIYFY
jgi:hypothetical protein